MSEEKKEDVVDLLNADNLVESISVSRLSVSEPISQTNEGEKSASSESLDFGYFKIQYDAFEQEESKQ